MSRMSSATDGLDDLDPVVRVEPMLGETAARNQLSIDLNGKTLAGEG